MNIYMLIAKKVTVLALIISLVFSYFVADVQAQVANFSEAKVSITFDDGFASTYTNALPILSSRSLPATLYVTSGFINDGVTDDGFPAMTWDQVRSLQNDYSWEIGGHTSTHPELTLLTPVQIEAQLTGSNSVYATQGLNISNFATPYGDYNNTVLAQVLKYYYSHRGFADRDALNALPFNRAVLMVQDINDATTPAMVQSWVNQAQAEKRWLILVMHDVQPQTNPNYEYIVTIDNLTAMADIIKNSGVKVQTVRDASKIPGTNVLTNSGFESGLTTGWTTDNSAQVTVDNNNNGNYPSPETSVKLTGSATANHLFSTLINAVPGATYLLESFVNTTSLTSGEFGFYMDEYDALGNWVSGQWLGNLVNNTVGFFNRVYQTTSNLVSQLSVQAYLTAGAVGNVYVDSINLHNLSHPIETPTPTPTASPSVTPSPTPVATASSNLVSNFGFENLTTGWADSWTRDNNSIVIDTDSQGTEGENSVHLTPNVANAHLFSSKIDVLFGETYNLSQDIKTTAAGGEFGFYIDEYDSLGNWISGQWKGAIKSIFNGVMTLVYTPSSNLVKSIGLQYYATAGSVFDLYLDNIQLHRLSQPITTPSATPSPTPTGTPDPSVSPTPSPTPTGSPSPSPTPTPEPTTNLVSNFSFENLVAGWADLWERDSNDFSIDVNSNGNDGVNSLHLVPNTAYSHAFSSKITVDPLTSYIWKQNVKAVSTGVGEFGFYIDEYDAANNWISGQWKGALFASFTGDVQFNYTPTSSQVSTVRLQYYATPGSLFDLYLDSVTLSK